MFPSDDSPRSRDWYKISVDSLRSLGGFLLLVALVVFGWWAYREVKPQLLRREASLVLTEAGQLLARVESEPGNEAYRSRTESARLSLEEATEAFSEGVYDRALREGKAARVLLATVLEALIHRRPVGDANFLSVRGRVEFRRGEQEIWRQATGRVVLNSGDFVKTADNGVAEIMFGDGTLYTVRPNTLFVVKSGSSLGGKEESIAMEYGWVNLSTARRPSTVTTPGAEARVEEESEGEVAIEEGGEGRFAALRGTMQVRSDAGAVQDLDTLQEVRLDPLEGLSEPRSLPDRPVGVSPQDNLEVDLTLDDTLVLEWSEVAGAEHYELQVAADRSFAESIIDADDRLGTTATLGLRAEGRFVWRVAAVDEAGSRGPWSDLLRFRVIESTVSGGVGALAGPAAAALLMSETLVSSETERTPDVR